MAGYYDSESKYGFINYALELLVVRKYGQETWNEIKKKAEVDIEKHFLLRMIYDDQVTFDLVNVACDVLGLSQNEILEQFGAMFFKFCQESNYDKILQVLGGSLKDFLCNLDALHDHLGTIYPGMRAPSFRCVERSSDGALVLYYYSYRIGLEHIVIGIVKAVAKKLHNCQVDVVIEKTRNETGDHVEFAIHMKPTEISKLDKRKSIMSLIGTPNDLDAAAMSEDMLIGSSTFCKAFPFHIMFDRDLNIQQAGTSVARVIPHMLNQQFKFSHLFDLVRPQMEFNFDSVLSHINTVFVLKTHDGFLDVSQLKSSSEIFRANNQSVLRLKGQMLYIKESDVMLFLCSPSVGNLDDLQGRGLYLSDIPIHDATRDLILLSEQFKAEYELTQKLEVLTDELQNTYRKLEEEKRRTDQLLYSILPPSVAKELRQGGTVEAKKFDAVTILFSGIVGFQKICQDSEPMVIVKLLNDIYTAFDDNIRNDVYKVETVGDMYMIVGGLPKRSNTHAKSVALMALDMIQLTQRIKVNDQPVKITIGIHSGEIVAGVVGKKLPRYCLFGNTVNITSRTQTTGAEGKINLTEVTHKLLLQPQCQDSSFCFTQREDLVRMKGRKEPMKCYFLERHNKNKAVHLIMRNSSANRSFLFKPRESESSPQFTPPSHGTPPLTLPMECPFKTEKLLQSVVNKLI
ncbi:uncharacterized protein TRIADDRAFT_56641 [Trichoplax adhaerens]|uniref:Guanylate cyclase soluble subunit beta-1 n=1 Tax=Trichoplax adhaerens TaxID=10228 RepID=B3RYQ6_TRIAD|nr:hypothetical protein TRIADDRAFT_56641 [Trichoplax adhaerens]EDV24636.1 hypothetical protein TRIADDRAFT_56641 [Trichoplax adhaerens]|eukprot:XP_002112526.1 hypothetical protein TRIADDRAFT_56641 [Trichoplax adhaerens]